VRAYIEKELPLRRPERVVLETEDPLDSDDPDASRVDGGAGA